MLVNPKRPEVQDLVVCLVRGALPRVLFSAADAVFVLNGHRLRLESELRHTRHQHHAHRSGASSRLWSRCGRHQRHLHHVPGWVEGSHASGRHVGHGAQVVLHAWWCRTWQGHDAPEGSGLKGVEDHSAICGGQQGATMVAVIDMTRQQWHASQIESNVDSREIPAAANSDGPQGGWAAKGVGVEGPTTGIQAVFVGVGHRSIGFPFLG
mmetsp:Transcript_14267/g.37457  ORF Transcript_14267/g.37457 Transcript_14267/m.37457 type:complete len:209 (+) Transcript_14267:608-1234(+)